MLHTLLLSKLSCKTPFYSLFPSLHLKNASLLCKATLWKWCPLPLGFCIHQSSLPVSNIQPCKLTLGSERQAGFLPACTTCLILKALLDKSQGETCSLEAFASSSCNVAESPARGRSRSRTSCPWWNAAGSGELTGVKSNKTLSFSH